MNRSLTQELGISFSPRLLASKSIFVNSVTACIGQEHHHMHMFPLGSQRRVWWRHMVQPWLAEAHKSTIREMCHL